MLFSLDIQPGDMIEFTVDRLRVLRPGMGTRFEVTIGNLAYADQKTMIASLVARHGLHASRGGWNGESTFYNLS
ncbi:hypothetical protein FJZ48_01025 [Candidatus Uhrbacteria bacterium]|nr:hypothetical protein [Candidatus Uhrbacteria bacterium]